MYEEARAILESGDLEGFREFTSKSSDFAFQHAYHVEDEVVSFPILLVQTFRRLHVSGSSAMNLKPDRPPPPVEEFTKTLQFLKKKGAQMNFKDLAGRTVAHWAVLLQAKELLQTALKLGCDPLIQDTEGQTITHLAVRVGCTDSLNVIRAQSKDASVLEEVSQCSGATPLIYAVQINATEMVNKLLQLGVNPNTAEDNQYRRTALHYALYTNQENIFEMLLKSGARPDIPDYRHKTVVHRLTDCSNQNFVKLVTKYAAASLQAVRRQSIPSSVGDLATPLIMACSNEDVDTVQSILQSCPAEELLKLTDEDKRTALHHCAENTTTKCAAVLLSANNGLVNSKDISGLTPLHLATISSNVQLMKFLLEQGANVDECDGEGHAPLHWAVVGANSEAVNLLLKHKCQVSPEDIHGARPLHYATKIFTEDATQEKKDSGTAIVKKLIKKGASVNDTDKEGRTPFLWASFSMNAIECCRLLYKNGAKADLRDKEGLTALHYAANCGNLEMSEFLLQQCKHPVDAVDSNGCSPLFYAVTFNYKPIAELLLKRGAKPNLQDRKARTVAHCAAKRGLTVMLELLTEHKGNLWITTATGDLPLHDACRAGHVGVIKYLLSTLKQDKIACVNLLDGDGMAPLHLAAMQGSLEMCQLLVENSADKDTLSNSANKDKSGKTALEFAVDKACRDYLKSIGCKTGREIRNALKKDRDPNASEMSAQYDDMDDDESLENIRPPSRIDEENESVVSIDLITGEIKRKSLSPDRETTLNASPPPAQQSSHSPDNPNSSQNVVLAAQPSEQTPGNSTSPNNSQNIPPPTQPPGESSSPGSPKHTVPSTRPPDQNPGNPSSPGSPDTEAQPTDKSPRNPSGLQKRSSNTSQQVVSTNEPPVPSGKVSLKDSRMSSKSSLGLLSVNSERSQSKDSIKFKDSSSQKSKLTRPESTTSRNGEPLRSLQNVRSSSSNDLQGSKRPTTAVKRKPTATASSSSSSVPSSPQKSTPSFTQVTSPRTKTPSTQSSLTLPPLEDARHNRQGSNHHSQSQSSLSTLHSKESQNQRASASEHPKLRKTTETKSSPSVAYRSDTESSIQTTPRIVRSERPTLTAKKRGAGARSQGGPKSSIAQKVIESVREYEAVRHRNAEVNRMNRMRMQEGNMSDRMMMNAVKTDFQRNYYYSSSNGNLEGGFPSSRYSSSEWNSHSHNPEEDEELRRKIHETTELFQIVNRRATETLTNTREINSTLEEELRNLREVQRQQQKLGHQRSGSRPKTGASPLRANNKRPITASLSEAIRQERLHKVYGPPPPQHPPSVATTHQESPRRKAPSSVISSSPSTIELSSPPESALN